MAFSFAKDPCFVIIVIEHASRCAHVAVFLCVFSAALPRLMTQIVSANVRQHIGHHVLHRCFSNPAMKMSSWMIM